MTAANQSDRGVPGPGAEGPGFRHAALGYTRGTDCVAPVMSFARQGAMERDALLVGVCGPLDYLLRPALKDLQGPAGERPDIAFFDMGEVGRNPSRIISAMRDFTVAHAGRGIRHVTEPFWPKRPAAEVIEAMRHEALVNLAFPEPATAVLCLYDTASLDPDITVIAEQTHPTVVRDGTPQHSSRYAGPGTMPARCDTALAPPPQYASRLSYHRDLRPVRDQVAACAREAGLADDRAGDLMLAASEVAANTLHHTQDGGTLRVWRDKREVVCQVEDSGTIADPLAGRRRPADGPPGHGLWVVNQICDLVELRSGGDGTVVRMHMNL